MERQEFGDETLMAYADGELDAATARAVEAAAEADAGLALRIALFARTGDALGAAARARPLEPLSPGLEARVRAALGAPTPDKVVPFRRRLVGWPVLRPVAAAAALALAVGVAGGYIVAQATGDRAQGGLRIASLEDPDIARALDSLPSGQRVGIGGGEILAIASFVNADGEFCREFEHDRETLITVVSVACRTEAGWQQRLAIVAAGADDTGYAPASSLETLDAYLTAIGAGAPLAPEDEASALRDMAP